MNRSGESIKCLLGHFRSTPEDLIVIYDDLDLAFGRIRIRPTGGAGGHRGVLSILESLPGAQFYRVRVGIGRPPDGMDPVDFVLEHFTLQEIEQLDEVVSRASEAAVLCCGRVDNGLWSSITGRTKLIVNTRGVCL
jgi:PTH1 family peptidyl-tRNA hydrolase